jgi:hypothetical protein
MFLGSCVKVLGSLFERLRVHIQSFAKYFEVSLRILSIILPSRVVSNIEIVNKVIERIYIDALLL